MGAYQVEVSATSGLKSVEISCLFDSFYDSMNPSHLVSLGNLLAGDPHHERIDFHGIYEIYVVIVSYARIRFVLV